MFKPNKTTFLVHLTIIRGSIKIIKAFVALFAIINMARPNYYVSSGPRAYFLMPPRKQFLVWHDFSSDV